MNVIRRCLRKVCRLLASVYISQNREVDHLPSGYSELVIVSMTSWKRRINNVPQVYESIMGNTIKPDKFILNLSSDEFSCGEPDLPIDLLALISTGEIELFWVKENTKAFKKIIPTMLRYPNDIIISIDDDFIYPGDFIESFIMKHKKCPGVPISGNQVMICNTNAHCGCASLVKRAFFGKYLVELYDSKVQEIGTDDVFYTLCAAMNGTKYEYVGKDFFTNMQSCNPVDGISDIDGGTKIWLMESYLLEKIKKKYHIDVRDVKYPKYVL